MKLNRDNTAVSDEGITRNRLLCVKSPTQEMYVNLSLVTKCELVERRIRFLSETFVLDIDLANATEFDIKEKLLDYYIQATNTAVVENHVIHFKDKISEDYISTKCITGFTFGANNIRVQTQHQVLIYDLSVKELEQVINKNYAVVYTANVGLFRMIKL